MGRVTIVGVPGRLSPDLFGYTGPVSATNIDAPPHYYRGARIATFDFETDSDAAAAIVPEGLEIAHDIARARVFFADFPFSTLGPYREAMLSIHCNFQGRRVLYTPYLIVTGDIGLIAGREIWGAPKLLGEISFDNRNATVTCTVERPAGITRIAQGTIRPRDIVEPRPGADLPMVNLKIIPSAELGAPPEVCQLVEVGMESTIQRGADGRPWLFTGPATLELPSPSPTDPWKDLPVKRILRATYGKWDTVLGPGRILHRYH